MYVDLVVRLFLITVIRVGIVARVLLRVLIHVDIVVRVLYRSRLDASRLCYQCVDFPFSE